MKIVNKYRYELTDRRGTLDVAPLGEADFNIDYSREDDGKYFYSREFRGKLKFAGATYGRLLRILKSVYICTEQRLKVFRACDPEVIIFDGFFKLTEGDWDEDRCEVVLKFEKNVPDRCLDLKKNEKIDIMQFVNNRVVVKTAEVGAGTFEYVEYVKNRSHASPADLVDAVWNGSGDPYEQNWVIVENSARASSLETDPPSPTPDIVYNHRTLWVREIVILDASITAPSAYVLIEDRTAIDNTKVYARQATLINCEYYNNQTSEYNYERSQVCAVLGDGETSGSEIDNGMRLEEIFAVFMNKFCGDLTVVSDFFQINPENPSLINYVTGEETETAEIIFFQKSDVKRPKAYNNATRALISFDKFIEVLITMFNVAYIVENGVFRIEHFSWFTRNIGLDLTDPIYKKWTVAKNKYSFDNSEIPSTEKWTFKEQSMSDAWKGQIKYNNACAVVSGRNNEKNYVIDEFMTDITLALSNPDKDSNIVADAGMVIVATRKISGIYYLISSAVGGYQLNNTLGWRSLVRKYHFHNRFLPSGLFNEAEVDFLTTRPFKKGEKITIPLCCGTTFNPNDKIITELGEAIIDKAVFKLKNETLDITPLFDAFHDLTQNIKPEITGQNFSIYKNNELNFTVIATDPDGTIEEIQIDRAPLNGTITIVGMDVKYIPNLDFVGMDYFRLVAYDDWSEVSDFAGFFVEVKPPNVAPNAVDDFYNCYHGETFSSGSGVLANDGDPDGVFSLITTSATTTQGVSITMPSDGKFNYVPPTGFEGVDQFDYTIEDDGGLQSTATVFINVQFKNKPLGISDYYQTRKNTTLTIDGVSSGQKSLLFNDYAPDGVSYPMTATAETKTTTNGGTVTIYADGLFSYIPASGFTGSDSFNYTVNNPNGSGIGNVTIGVLPDIWVKLITRNNLKINISIECDNGGGEPIDVYGLNWQRDYVLKFYSDAGGTVPINVSGLNFNVNMNEYTTYSSGGSPVSSNFPVGALSGTEELIFDDFLYIEEILDCSLPTNQINRSLSIIAGSYYIIT